MGPWVVRTSSLSRGDCQVRARRPDLSSFFAVPPEPEHVPVTSSARGGGRRKPQSAKAKGAPRDSSHTSSHNLTACFKKRAMATYSPQIPRTRSTFPFILSCHGYTGGGGGRAGERSSGGPGVVECVCVRACASVRAATTYSPGDKSFGRITSSTICTPRASPEHSPSKSPQNPDPLTVCHAGTASSPAVVWHDAWWQQ
jgi:hypothetical protein